MAYDIFISYRRKGAGAGVAGELQSKLENRGYKVFLDVDEMASGQFPVQIDQAIDGCKDFLLVLAPGTLDRCNDEEDWVRHEIVKAEDLDKNLIGIMLPGFIMPEAEDLPEPLQGLPTKQVFLWSHEYRVASFEKIEENLVSARLKKRRDRKKLALILSAVLVLIALAFVVLHNRPKPIGGDVDDSIAMAFDSHVKKAAQLMDSLPAPAEFNERFNEFINNNEGSFKNLMSAIGEYEAAIQLKNDYPKRIVDNVNVESELAKALDLRKAYWDLIVADINELISVRAGDLADQEIRIAGILAINEKEKQIVESLAQLAPDSV